MKSTGIKSKGKSKSAKAGSDTSDVVGTEVQPRGEASSATKESKSMNAVVNTKDTRPTLPLSALVLDESNVRTNPRTGIESLAASILSLGVVQNVVVVPIEGEKNKYGVAGGGRRLEALQLLLSQGAIDAAYPVPYVMTTRERATEASMAENLQQPMHPADQFEAFQRLAKEGKTIDAIADAFGVTPLVVERRLKLAQAAPELIEEFRADELTTDQLIALCASDDHDRQLQVWRASKGRHWMCDAKSLRAAVLAEGEIDVSKDRRVAFIGGLDVYRQAGGDVRRDLLSGDGDGGFITDGALLDKLVADKLDAEAEAVRGEGWGWVEVWPEFDHQLFGRFGQAPKTDGELPPKLAEHVAALKAEHQALHAEQAQIEQATEESDDDYTEEQSDRLDAIWDRQEQIDATVAQIEEAHAYYTPEVKQNSGAVVCLGRDGLVIERGLVKAADRKAVNAAAGDATAVLGGRETESAGRKTEAVSDALRRSLLGHRNLAVQEAVSSNVNVALVLFACWTVERIRDATVRRYSGSPVPSDFALSECGHGTRTNHKITDEPGQAKEKAFAERGAQLVAKLPKGDADLWDALGGMASEQLDEIIAYGIALSVSVAQDHKGFTGKLLAALDFDMADHFKPTAENYLGRVPKPLIVAAVKQAGKLADKADGDALLAMKKGALAGEAETRLAGTGWVPEAIRGPKPKADKAPAKKAAKKPAKKAAKKA